MRGGRVAIAAVSVVLLGFVFADGAQACSCAPSAPVESLVRSDAAIVGRLLQVRPAGPTRARYRYRVVRVVRGARTIERGAVVAVSSPRGVAACALPRRGDRDYGLFLVGEAGHWASGLCGVVSPRRLEEAAQHEQAVERAAPAAASCAS